MFVREAQLFICMHSGSALQSDWLGSYNINMAFPVSYKTAAILKAGTFFACFTLVGSPVYIVVHNIYISVQHSLIFRIRYISNTFFIISKQ